SYEPAASDPLAVACRMAVQSGLVVVAAAGNFGKDANGNPVYGTITSPGTEPSVITVGAVTTWGTPSRADDVIATYSSKGPTPDRLMKPDIAAPGSRIPSTASAGNHLLTANPDLAVGIGYMKLSGTSMAAPVVSGAAAMLLAAAPNLTPNAVKAILMYTAERKGEPLAFGAGEINMVGAMDLARAVNPSAGIGQYWLTNPTLFATPYNAINGYSALWGQTIVWADSLRGGQNNFLNYNLKLFG